MKIKNDTPDNDHFGAYFVYDEAGRLHLRLDRECRAIWLGTFAKFIQKLNATYKTEEDAKEEIFQRLNTIQPFTCTKCDCHEFHREYGATKGRCKACNTEVWFMAQSPFFSGMKKPKARLFLILLMENGIIFNTRQFSEALLIAYSTAWSLNAKAKQALLDALSESVEVESVDSLFFAQVFTKRSIATAANQHPVSEQELMENLSKTEKKRTNEKQQAGSDTENQSREAHSSSLELLAPLTELQEIVYNAIGTEPMQGETLINLLKILPSELSAALTILELNGLISSLPGGRYVRAEAAQQKTKQREPGLISERTESIIESAIKFIQRLFHGVSRKYIQFYVAYFWLIRNKGIGDYKSSFFKACYDSGESGLEAIKSFVSPLKLQMSTAEIL